MVQGNWERRAEMSVTRRLEAKQRKQRNSERKKFKAQAHDLMSFLNRNADQLFRRESLKGQPIGFMIHIWTDMPPCSEDGSPLHHRLLDEEHANKKVNRKHYVATDKFRRQARVNSFKNDDSSRSTKSNKNNGIQKKKFHPRSKESLNDNNCICVEASERIPIDKEELCRSHFFQGKCNGRIQKNRRSGGKNYSCRFAHYPKNYLTIIDVLLSTGLREGDREAFLSNTKEIISASENSCPDFVPAGSNTPIVEAMDMVYYLSFRVDQLFGHLDYRQPVSSSISHLIVDAMAKQSCNVGSIVYFAVGNQLLYDRYRKGMVVDESKLFKLGRNKTLANKKRSAEIQSMSLSASILEHILLFLDDSAVASMSSVSHSWNQEIGKDSGNLWRHLLQRRSWPVPSVTHNENKNVASTLREAFLSHYMAIRDINGIKKGIHCLLTRKSMSEFDGSFRSFESAKGSLQAKKHCVAVRIWAANCFLVAHRQDCSLRLFDSVQGSKSSDERLCRESICHCIDPYKRTKKRHCQLVTIALDTDFIGCMLLVLDDVSENEYFILCVLSRDTFLINDDSDYDAMQVINIRQSILNFLLSSDDINHELLQLHEYLSSNGDLNDIEVTVSQSLAECGHGRFVIEAAISIPSIHTFDEQDSFDTLIFRKFFLFSIRAEAITWMSDSFPSSTLLSSLNEETILCSLTMRENCRNCYEILSLFRVSPAIMSISVDYDGNLQRSTMIQGTSLVRNEILADNWSLRPSQKRPAVMLRYEVVVADNLVCDEQGAKKAIVTFYPKNNNCGRSVLKSLHLFGNIEVCHLVALRTAHIIAICRIFESTSDTDDIEELDGHWFGPATPAIVSAYAIIIDVQSRSEIYRTCIVEDLCRNLGKEYIEISSSNGEFPIKLAVQENTVVAALSYKGVVITGADARDDRFSSIFNRKKSTTSNKSTKKAKRKKLFKKRGKKDGFARGQKM